MALIGLLYLVIFLIFILSGIIILYHISRYSYNKTAMLFMILSFSFIMVILLIINLTLFFSLDFKEIISNINI